MRRLALTLLALLALLVLPALPAAAAPPESCGAPEPTKVITGSFASEQTGSFVMVPFRVPRGTTAIRGWYCYDQPESPSSQSPAFAVRHTLDFGYYAPRPRGRRMWTMREFRGWSGSGFFDDITVSARPFADDPDPSTKPVGATSRGYRAGPIRPGRWAVELGVAAVVPPDQGDADGSVNWRVELRLERNRAFARPAKPPQAYDPRPARRGPGWFAGDFHVHTDQSGDAKQNAPASDVLDYAFASREEGGAGLDFVQVTDHNTDAGWPELARRQADHPGKLISRDVEITTYRGHVNAPGIGRLPDYRTGSIYRRRADGSLVRLRDGRPASEIFDAVHASGGTTTINHPTIFDAAIPPFGVLCRGCSWEYTDEETGYEKVDAVEVATGPQSLKISTNPGPNPFTPLALDFYERALDRAGHVVAAVSGSDSHSGGNASFEKVTATPVGSPATMVFARNLSERAIADAVRAGHTYVRAFGLASPELRFEARAEGRPPAIMGDTLHAPSATFTARVTGAAAGPEPLQLMVMRDGAWAEVVPVVGEDFTHTFSAEAPRDGTVRYGLRLMRGSAIEGVSTPIFLTRAPAEPLRARGVFARRLAVRGRRVVVGCRARGEGLRACRVRVGRLGAATAVMYRPGTRRVAVRLRRRPRGRRAVTVRTAALGDGTRGRVHRRRALLTPGP